MDFKSYCEQLEKYIPKRYPNLKDLKNSGMDMTFERYQQLMSRMVAERETEALNATVTKNGMFTLSAKSTAAMGEWAQSDVNYAHK